MLFALVGNQNTGKTTLFNRLTGSNQHAGNFPGVTVECKTGKIREAENLYISDLPGIYSLTPYTSEEIYARDFILNEKPDGIINILDATNLERNLYLSIQLLTLGIPTVIALNMMDEFEGNGGKIDISLLSALLGVPVVPVSAVKNQGIDLLVRTAESTAGNKLKPDFNMFFTETEDYEKIAKARYELIEKILKDTVVKPKRSKERTRSEKIDKILTNKYFGIPLFLFVMLGIFYLTFNAVGAFLKDILESGIEFFTFIIENIFAKYNVNPLLHSLVTDGILAGVGSVLSFLPIIVVLFFFLSLLEDTGYMARISFIMDKPLRTLGLSGKSFVPMLIGFGCTVPAVMATRTLSSNRDKIMTVMFLPFISCSAKIPVYAVFTSAFFKENQALVMLLLYAFGIFSGILSMLVLNKTIFKGEPSEFVMELPNYRFPSLKSVLLLMWDKAKEFTEKAFTVIFLGTVIIWFLQSFDISLRFTQDNSKSILSMLGKAILPVFKPIGFNNWQTVTSLIAGFTAKEAVISTMSVLFSTDAKTLSNMLSTYFTLGSASSFLSFTLLYTPCVASIAAIKKELNSGLKALLISILQCVIAYTFAFLVYKIIG